MACISDFINVKVFMHVNVHCRVFIGFYSYLCEVAKQVNKMSIKPITAKLIFLLFTVTEFLNLESLVTFPH